LSSPTRTGRQLKIDLRQVDDHAVGTLHQGGPGCDRLRERDREPGDRSVAGKFRLDGHRDGVRSRRAGGRERRNPEYGGGNEAQSGEKHRM
jgi:hypothetical protein